MKIRTRSFGRIAGIAKAALALAVCFAMTFAAFAPLAARAGEVKDMPEPSQALVGDINGDGKVDIADVNAIINMMLGKVEAVPAADLNGDGNVDISDVNAIINLMLGKVTDR